MSRGRFWGLSCYSGTGKCCTQSIFRCSPHLVSSKIIQYSLSKSPFQKTTSLKNKWVISWIGKNLPDGKSWVADVAPQGINLIDVTSVPRLSFAQKLDCLSSQAKIAGHRAVLEAAMRYGKFTAPEITAAGKYAPAHVMVRVLNHVHTAHGQTPLVTP